MKGAGVVLVLVFVGIWLNNNVAPIGNLTAKKA
jgi:hypothetical protein